jgi:hypothetical protein
MATISNDDRLFKSQWNASVGAGSLVIAAVRSVEGPAPHGIGLENGILHISAWIGDASASGMLFGDLCKAAKRMLGVSATNGDSFEDKFRDLLSSRPADNATNNDSGNEMEHPGAQVEVAGHNEVRPSTENSPPTVKTVIIHLVCHPDSQESDLSDWNPVHIPWRNNVVPVIVRVVRSDTSLENIRVIGTSSAISAGANDQLIVAFVRLGDLKPLLDRGNAAYAANVRRWLGDNTVTNSRLKDVFNLVAEGGGNPEMFPFNHNGVAISCSGMTASDDGFVLTNPQVINGQQTLCGWWNVYNAQNDKARLERLAKLVVMVRMVQTHTKSTLDQITFANNRQNAVSAVELRSNEACMGTIEKAFNFDESNCIFQRKKGIDKRKGIDARLIFETWKLLADERIGEEAFFDDKKKFERLFVGLAETLTHGTDEQREMRRNRLIGLWQFSRLRFGKVTRTAIADVLFHLGVHKNTLGDAVMSSGDGPTLQRKLVYALWPLIQQGLMHLMLRTPEWQGVDREIKLLEETSIGKGKRAAKTWTTTPGTRRLLESLPRLPPGLITDFMSAYKRWIDDKNYDTAESDPETLFANFVSEKVTLNEMLKHMQVRRAHLVTEL